MKQTNLFMSERRNIYLFYILSACMNLWFIASNWIYFWTKFMTFGQLGWVDAIAFGFAIILEIPSGAVADLLGKKRTIMIGMLAGSLGIFIVSFSNSLTSIFWGWMIAQINFSLFSGAAEALAYDSLVDMGEEDKFDEVITKSSQIESLVTAAATFLGGYLYVVHFRLPHVFWGLGFVLGFIFSLFLIEPKVDTEKFSWKAYLNQLSVGIKELTQSGLKRYIGYFFILVGVYNIYSWGFLRPAIATSFGFFAREQGIILPALTLFGVFVLKLVPWLKRRMSDIGGLVILSIIMAVGFLIASFTVGYFGIVALLLIAMAGKLANPWISIVVNKKISSKYRATTLSTVALMTKLPYVLVAVVVGGLIESGYLLQFNLGLSLVIVFVGVGSAVMLKVRKS